MITSDGRFSIRKDMDQKIRIKATFAIILAGVLWGLMGTFVKMLGSYGFGAVQIQGMRSFYGAVIYLVILLIYKPSLLRIELRDLWMFIGTGIISTVFFSVCYFYTGIHSEISVAVVLLYTSPIFVMILSAILFQEKITGKKVLVLIMTFLGCVLVAGISGASSHLTTVTLLTGLASGFFYALYSVFGKYALQKYEPLTVTACTFICSTVFLLPFSGVGEILHIYKESPGSILWSLGSALICTVIAYFLYNWGLQYLEPGRAAILVTTEPLVGALLGMVLFRESHGVTKLLGIGLILGAIFILSGGKEEEEAAGHHKDRALGEPV